MNLRLGLVAALWMGGAFAGVVCAQPPVIIRGEAPLNPGFPSRTTRSVARPEPTAGVMHSDDPRAAEIKLTDGGMLRVNLLDKEVALVTPFGKLQIPLDQIQRIELAQRVPEDLRKKAEKLIGLLGSSEFQDREAASKDLLALGEQIWPVLAKAAEGTDLEVSQRINDLVSQIRSKLPDDQQEVRANDVIYTADSKFTGKLEGVEFKASTTQFGEQTLQLWDVVAVRRLNASAGDDDAGGPVLPDPGSLTQYHGQQGKTLRFRVTGANRLTAALKAKVGAKS